METVLQGADLISEGKYWVGGLASFSIIVLVSFSYAFRNTYLKQYQMEGFSPSYFACDTSLCTVKLKTNEGIKNKLSGFQRRFQRATHQDKLNCVELF